jgi:hypothetical protein
VVDRIQLGGRDCTCITLQHRVDRRNHDTGAERTERDAHVPPLTATGGDCVAAGGTAGAAGDAALSAGTSAGAFAFAALAEAGVAIFVAGTV